MTDNELFDQWLDALPENPYDLCPCGCGMKFRFAEKEGLQKHFEKWIEARKVLERESK